jgi:iron(III) transport system ATP-binding protein
MTELSVRGLHKAYGSTPVLTGVDLTIADGAFLSILGSSGSGKTTLLRAIAGFERADRGTIRLGSTVVDDGSTVVAPERRRVGYVPQEGALFPHLTVAANVGFGLPRRTRRAHRSETVDEMLEMVGMAAMAGRYPHQLSGGQQQRVAVARALAAKPGLVLLDEPFSSLDASLRATLRADVADILSETRTTTLLVTHDQDEALSMADTVAVLRDGTIVQAGTPEEIYSHPVDVQLARFVGDANLVRGELTGGRAATALGSLAVVNPVPDGSVTVLLRPEQLEVEVGGTGPSGRVMACEYYGHDAVMRVRAALDGNDRTELFVRVEGRMALAPGTEVSLRAVGPVTAWPATDAPG